MTETKTKLQDGGRLVIPSRYRKALDLKPGDEVVLLLEEGEIRVTTTRQAVRRAQALVRRYVPRRRRLSEELIKERREEVSRG